MARTPPRPAEADVDEMLGVEVHKVGNLTRAPELARAESGVDYATFGLAVERPVIEGDWSGPRDVTFYDVVCFGTLAGNVTATLRKGTRVVVVGRTETRGYMTGEGEVRHRMRIIAEAVGVELRWARATIRKVRPTKTASASSKHPRRPVKRTRTKALPS